MTAAWFALIGSFGGAAIAFLGNAFLEARRRGAVRRDAAGEREAANLRDLQDAISDFATVWGPILANVLTTGTTFNAMDPANADGRPGATYNRLMAVAHRIQFEATRGIAHDWAGRQLTFARTGDPAWIPGLPEQRQLLETGVAERIRQLEAAPISLVARIGARTSGLLKRGKP
jgi:hypothetical protein